MKKKFLIVCVCILMLSGCLMACTAKQQRPDTSSSDSTPPVQSTPEQSTPVDSTPVDSTPEIEEGEHVNKEYYDDGTLKQEETLVVNSRHVVVQRTLKTYYENGNPERETTWGIQNGVLIVETDAAFREDGTQEQYVEYHKNGKEKLKKTYWENGNPKKEAEYYESGVLEVEKFYREDGTDEKYIEYYLGYGPKYEDIFDENGIIKRRTYFYLSGNIDSDIRYDEYGFFKESVGYYESGKIRSEGHAPSEGRPGIANLYYEDGTLEKRTVYIENEGGKEIDIEYVEYDKNGNPVVWETHYEEYPYQLKEEKSYYPGTDKVHLYASYYNFHEGNSHEYIEYGPDGSIIYHSKVERYYYENGNYLGWARYENGFIEKSFFYYDNPDSLILKESNFYYPNSNKLRLHTIYYNLLDEHGEKLVKEETIYDEDGNIIAHRELDEKGNIISSFGFEDLD